MQGQQLYFHTLEQTTTVGYTDMKYETGKKKQKKITSKENLET